MALVVAPSAQAAFTSVYGGAAHCTVEPSHGNIRACSGFTLTWDHATKIDVNVFLPPETGGTEGPYPLIGDFHGWGGSKLGLTTVEPAEGLTFQQKDPRIQHWAEEGYAVFSMSDRGWGLSCGKFDPQIAEPVCAQGYNHLMDDRYEVRDAQYLISVLADEGVAQPMKIGVTGASYGGGISVALAALRNREMLPNGELVPWTSPEGEEMEIAAAAPQWAWTDIAYALAPNGRNLDYVTESSYRGPSGKAPVGVMKLSYTEALYQSGLALSNYNESNPEADIPGWRLRLLAGEPYSDPGVNAMIKQLTAYHSAFYINHAEAPSPMLLQSGWNDDLFPVDEVLRLYQRTRAQYPSDPISLFLADYGHSRSQNKAADVGRFNERLEAWFAHYLKGEGASPSSSVEALTTTCPNSAASEGPYTAGNWSSLAPGEVRLQSNQPQTIEHGTVAEEEVPTLSGKFFDPIIGPKVGKNVCSSVPAEAQPRVANYSLAPAPAGGFTLMGSPTIVAKVQSPTPNSEIAARLVDVAPEGTETLIARGLYRPTGGSQEMVFQLHPQGYHFAAGHVAKLELLPSDMPYGRFSNLQANVTVSSLELRLPVMEQPGSLGGLVQTPAPKVVPAGYQLAAEYQEKPSGGGGGGTPPTTPPPATIKIGAAGLTGKLTANSKALMVPLRCTGEGACSGQVSVTVKASSGKGRTTLAKGKYSIASGANLTARVPLTKAGAKIVQGRLEIKGKRSKTLSGVLQLNDAGRPTTLTLNRPVHLTGGK
ncbi:MAG: acetylxylan esterase [Actinobacteria bacterium]|nr:acetylxylan esterase [Actinomycetota bacterium]